MDNEKADESQSIRVEDHLVIRDKESNEVIRNNRERKNIFSGEKDGKPRKRR